MNLTSERPLSRQTDESVAKIGPEKSSRIDPGLSILEAVTPPGVPLSQTEIAVWCGCTSEAIRVMELRALRKLRRRLGALGIGSELRDHLSGRGL